MGLSILVTTVKQRGNIALQLIQAAVQLENGDIKGTIKLKHDVSNHEIAYTPKTDVYSVQGKNIRGDLLDLFRRVKNLAKADACDAFCDEFELDADKLSQKNELMEYIGFVPCFANETIGWIFEHLSMLTTEYTRLIKEQCGWTKSVLLQNKATIYQRNDDERIVFPIFDERGGIVEFRAINPEDKEAVKTVGRKALPPFLFPDPKNLDKECRILITDGEVDALSALSQGIDAVSIVNWQHELTNDLNKYFKGREVVIAFRTDKNSQYYATLLAEALHPIAKQVYGVKWPESMGMPEDKGQGLYEYFGNHGGTVDSFSELQVPFKSGEPLPLRRELQKPSEYPVDALPPVIRDAVLDVSDAMQCSPALPAQSFLAVSALSVQGYLNYEIDGRSGPSSCFFVTIAESGERKSSIDRLAMAPIVKLESRLRARTKREMAKYHIDTVIRKKKESDALKSSSPERAFRELGPPPEHPLDGSLTCEEPTYEGLIVKMVHGQPSLGIFSDEGGRFLGASAMSKENQQKSAAGISTLWDGRSVSRTRVIDGSYVLDGRRLSMHLMVQPAIADQLLSNDLLISQGLMSRILIAYPPTNIGNRPYRRVNLNDSEALNRFNQVITDIHSFELPIKPGTTNELDPLSITLSDDAKERWIEFHNLVESEMSEGRKYASISGFAAKSAEHVARLACVMTFIDDTAAEEIPMQWVESAIRIVEYHLSETLRLFNAGQDSPDLKLAQKSLDWLRATYPTFSLVELYQNGPNQVRNRQIAARIVKILEDHRWVRRIEGETFVGYNKRRVAWQVVK